MVLWGDKVLLGLLQAARKLGCQKASFVAAVLIPDFDSHTYTQTFCLVSCVAVLWPKIHLQEIGATEIRH